MKNLIFILAFVLIGCKEYVEEDMTISVPTSLQLVTTNVTDNTQAYVDGNIYADGTEVAISDAIYLTKGMENVPPFYYRTGYKYGDVVKYDNKLYTANTDITYPTFSEIMSANDGVYVSPTWTELTTQNVDVDVDGYRFRSRVVGTEPHTALVTKITRISDLVELGEGVLNYVQGDEIIPYRDTGYIHVPCALGSGWCTVVFYNGNVYINALTPNINVAYDTRFNLGVDQSKFLTYLSPTNQNKPFDNKNYSVAIAQTTMTYTVKGLVKFDTLALGKLKADNATVIFRLPATSPNYDLWLDGTSVASGGNGVVTVVDRLVDGSRDDTGNLEKWETTEVFYSLDENDPNNILDFVMEANSTVEITLTGGNIELGTIMLGMSANGGYSNLKMAHSYRDFSIADYDVWGNIDYVERQRIITYRGSVDVPISRYDRTVRLMTSLGKQLVIVNGSTSKTIAPNSQSVFSSTQMIGRFMSFDCETKVSDGEMDRDAEYDFVLEELA